MARGRMISKKIAWDVTVNGLSSVESILSYTWTIPHLDRDGRVLGNGQFIKNKCLPMISDITVEDAEEFVLEWANQGLAILYQAKNGDRILQFANFKRLNKMTNPNHEHTALYGREAASEYPDPTPENIIIDNTEHKPIPIRKTRYVYILRAKNLYKIGLSGNPEGRRTTIQTARGEKVELLFFYKPSQRNPLMEEAFLHDHFDGKRYHGEWFKLTNEDIEYIKNREDCMSNSSIGLAEVKLSKGNKVQEAVVLPDEPASFEAEIRQTRRQSAAKPLDTHTCFTLVRDWVAENRTHLLLPVGEDISAAQLYQIPSKDRGVVKQLSKMLKANQVVAAMQHAQGMNGFKYGIFSPYLLKCVRNFVETILTEEQSRG